MKMDYSMIAASGGIGKPVKKKDCLDMRILAMGKTNRKQRIDTRPRKIRKRTRCIILGCNKPVGLGRHHMIQKSDVIIDHEYNLIDLCQEHHDQADEFEISQIDLFELKAHELGITIEELFRTLEEYAGVHLFIDGEMVKVEKKVFQKANRGQNKREIGAA
jgi:hypothetical protein